MVDLFVGMSVSVPLSGPILACNDPPDLDWQLRPGPGSLAAPTATAGLSGGWAVAADQ